MSVESYILLRSSGTGTKEDPFQPRQDDLLPYPSLAWTDVTGRFGSAAMQTREPRLVVIDATMSNADGLAMTTDTAVWMLISRQLNNADEIVQSNWNNTYSDAERAVRIAQLANYTDFNAAAISAWWLPGRTRFEVAIKLRNYLKTLED